MAVGVPGPKKEISAERRSRLDEASRRTSDFVQVDAEESYERQWRQVELAICRVVLEAWRISMGIADVEDYPRAIRGTHAYSRNTNYSYYYNYPNYIITE